MATTTTNLKLVKPDLTDFADIRVLNQNMDTLDNAVGGLDYIKNVTTSDSGLTFTKKDDSVVNVPLDYLKLTGGTVTGDTEFTGKLTNNSKVVGQLFDGSAEIKSILDWDKMKEVYGSTMTSTTAIVKGTSQTVTYPNWCIYNANLGLIYFNLANHDLYLNDDFTNYDEVIFQCVLSTTNTSLYPWKSKVLEYMFENHGYINVASDNGCDAIYHGFYQYGSKNATDVSTRRMLKYYDDSGYIANVFGVKYTEDK